MSKINYNKNVSQLTDYNYSFCDDEENSNKENARNNGNLYRKIDDLQKIIKRQYNMQIKNNLIIKEQSTIIQKMKESMEKIEKKVRGSQSSAAQKSISSISKNQSQFCDSVDRYFASKVRSKTNKRQESIKSKQNSSSRIKSAISTSKKKVVKPRITQSSEQDSNNRLLTSIVQRKLNIEKQLKQRLRNHLLKGKTKTMKTSGNYITYAI